MKDFGGFLVKVDGFPITVMSDNGGNTARSYIMWHMRDENRKRKELLLPTFDRAVSDGALLVNKAIKIGNQKNSLN